MSATASSRRSRGVTQRVTNESAALACAIAAGVPFVHTLQPDGSSRLETAYPIDVWIVNGNIRIVKEPLKEKESK